MKRAFAACSRLPSLGIEIREELQFRVGGGTPKLQEYCEYDALRKLEELRGKLIFVSVFDQSQ